jgi:Secretory lipase
MRALQTSQFAPGKPASPDYEIGNYQQFLLKGISVVVTDYEGAGTPGLPSYLVGPTEGKAGLDAVRAAQRTNGSGVSLNSPVGISGYSQGGQAAGWAAELQPKYASELKLKGVLAGGVPTDMNVEINHLNGNPTAGAGFALAALVGLDVAYKLDLAGRRTPNGVQVTQQVEGSCYAEYFTAFGTTSSGDVTQPDVLADPTWQSRFAESRLGTTAPGAPDHRRARTRLRRSRRHSARCAMAHRPAQRRRARAGLP